MLLSIGSLPNSNFQLERHQEALVDTDASLALVPTSFKALRTRARINLHLEKYDAAVSDFKAAIEQAGMEGSDADVRALKGDLRKAETALKRSKTKDYYKILGVSRDCNDADIKKAYRRESLKHHPDKVGRSGFLQDVFVMHGFDREETKRNSSLSSRPMRSCRIPGGGRGMIWARMRMVRVIFRGWVVWGEAWEA